MKIPENYGGLAIDADGYIDDAQTDAAEDTPTLAMPMPPPIAPPREQREWHTDECQEKHHPALHEGVESFCRRIGLHMPTFDREDILLIGVALFLFFSKDGDKECAILLIALLFFS